MRIEIGLGLALVGLAFGMAAGAPAQPADDGAIRAVESAQEAAWNAHDAAAYAALFAPDAEFVSALGSVSQGRERIGQRLGRAFATVFSASIMHIEAVSSRPLGPDAAVARITWKISGVREPDGKPVEDHRIVQTQALQRVGGRWLIASLQDTAVIDVAARGDTPLAARAPEAPSGPPAPAAPAKPRHCVLARANGDCLIPGKAR